MIDARELRIGNWVFNKATERKQIKEVYSDCSIYDPIPLTEEWLIRAGFEIAYSSNFRLKFDHPKFTECGFDYSHVPDKSMEGFRYYGHYIKIKWVHQLQNLFFCLSGEELEFSEQ